MQLVQLQQMYDEFLALDTVVVAVSQEDKDLVSHGKFLTQFKSQPPFEIVADLNREKTPSFDRITTYLIDKNGVVRQVFPNLIHHRASSLAVLREVQRIERNENDQ